MDLDKWNSYHFLFLFATSILPRKKKDSLLAGSIEVNCSRFLDARVAETTKKRVALSLRWTRIVPKKKKKRWPTEDEKSKISVGRKAERGERARGLRSREKCRRQITRESIRVLSGRVSRVLDKAAYNEGSDRYRLLPLRSSLSPRNRTKAFVVGRQPGRNSYVSRRYHANRFHELFSPCHSILPSQS